MGIFEVPLMSKRAMCAGFVALGVVACEPTDVTPIVTAPPAPEVAITFRDFLSGTVCSVVTQGGVLSIATLPGTIPYPAEATAAPVSCTEIDGARYDIDTASVLPSEFTSAALTAYGTGLLTGSMTPNGETLRNETGVIRR